MKLIFILFFLLILGSLHKSSGQTDPGAKNAALSYSNNAIPSDILGFFSNPAILSNFNWREVAVFYSPKPFGVKEISTKYAVYNEPLSFGNISIAYKNYGFDLYKENHIGIGFSKRIENFNIGITFTYQSLSIKNYGEDNAINLSAGFIYNFENNLSLGFYVNNILNSTYGNEKDNIPFILNIGGKYSVNNSLNIFTNLNKELLFTTSTSIGIEYFIIKHISIRTGLLNNPNSFSGGIGINYSVAEFDYAISNHNDLGITHQFGLNILFGSNSTRLERLTK